eukprot:scaffold21592_cov125-Isochrysis_galbana.AAC.3
MPLSRSTDHGAVSAVKARPSSWAMTDARSWSDDSSSLASDGTASASKIMMRVRLRRDASSTRVKCASRATSRCLAVRRQSPPPPGPANLHGSRVATSPLLPAGALATWQPAHAMMSAFCLSMSAASKTTTRGWIDGHHTRRPLPSPARVWTRQLSL